MVPWAELLVISELTAQSSNYHFATQIIVVAMLNFCKIPRSLTTKSSGVVRCYSAFSSPVIPLFSYLLYCIFCLFAFPSLWLISFLNKEVLLGWCNNNLPSVCGISKVSNLHSLVFVMLGLFLTYRREEGNKLSVFSRTFSLFGPG